MISFIHPKLSAISYLCLIVAFLFPFVEVQCNGHPVKAYNGYEVAFGNDASSNYDAFKGENKTVTPNQLVAAAFVLSLLAAIVAMASGVASSLISGIALVLLILAKPEYFDGEIQQRTAGIVGFEFKLGYYLSLALLACGSFFGIVASRVQATFNADTRGFEQLHAVLKELGLLAKFKKFKKHNASDDVLRYLTDEQLREIGVRKAGDRACLLAKFSALNERPNA